MLEIWKKNLQKSQSIVEDFISSEELMNKAVAFSELLTGVYRSGGKVMSCGNGGSHCDAMHFAEELTGRFCKDRKPLGAMALGDPSHVTCTSNDYGFEYIFSRQVEALGRTEDLLLVLSTSGNSKNAIQAVRSAKKMGIKTVGLLGKTGGELKNLVDLSIVVPAEDSGRIQEMHIKLIHTVIETVERELFPENYR
jgi:D-sedoheptulose 7-phosphate isomerase